MFRKENAGIFGNKIISKEFLAVELKGYERSSRKEFAEDVAKQDIQSLL